MPQPFAAVLWGFGYLVEVARVKGQPFVHLRCVAVQHVEFFFYDIVYGYDDIGRKWLRFLEVVAQVRDDGVVRQGGCVCADVGYGDHVCRVLYEDGCVAVVGVVVVGAMGQDEVWRIVANQANDFFAIFEGGFKFAIVVVEYVVFDARDRTCCLGFSAAATGEFNAADFVMTRVAVGDRDKFYLVSEVCVFDGDAARFDIAIVGVGAKDNDFQGMVVHSRSSI